MSEPTTAPRTPLKLGQMLPPFDLPAAGGGRGKLWDYRGRRPLVVWLGGATPEPGALAELAARTADVRAAGAELLVILAVDAETVATIQSAAGFRSPVLADETGKVHAAVGVSDGTLLVTDRNGVLRWRDDAARQPDVPEAVSWVEYLSLQCGTGAPAWPAE